MLSIGMIPPSIMHIKPCPGTCFLIEDAEDFSQLEKMGLHMPGEAMKGVGSTGVILDVTHEQQGFWPRLRHWFFADRVVKRFKKGQRVIYDRFIASDIYFRDENGEEIKRLKSVAIDCILGEILP